MELKEDIAFDQLREAIRKLPDDKKLLLKDDLSTFTTTEPKPQETFLELLLRGPVMSDEQYKEYKKTRKHMNKWRTK